MRALLDGPVKQLQHCGKEVGQAREQRHDEDDDKLEAVYEVSRGQVGLGLLQPLEGVDDITESPLEAGGHLGEVEGFVRGLLLHWKLPAMRTSGGRMEIALKDGPKTKLGEEL